MNARETCHALQAQLDAARDLLAAGERSKALEAIDAALEIDQNFLGAQLLRNQIQIAPVATPSTSGPARGAASLHAAATRSTDGPTPPPGPAEPARPTRTVAPTEPLESRRPNDNSSWSTSGALAEGFAQFEQRAKRRRAERRLETLRAAIAARREREAKLAIEELNELDPDLPDLRELMVQVDDLRRSSLRPRVGRWLVVATACFAVTFATLSFERARSLGKRTNTESAPSTSSSTEAKQVNAPRDPSSLAMLDASPTVPVVPSVATSGWSVLEAERRENATLSRSAIRPDPPAQVDVVTGERPNASPVQGRQDRSFELNAANAGRPTILDNRPTGSAAAVAEPSAVAASAAAPEAKGAGVLTPVSPPAAVPAIAVPDSAVAVRDSAVPIPGGAVSAAASPVPSDDERVKSVLQRYRSAFERLDAHSAAAVWPAVNENALARAFDGLHSQALTFDVCYVRLEDDMAAATCRGSARYIPKIGSREPRIEPRVWRFTLRKSGSDWMIENARAEQ